MGFQNNLGPPKYMENAELQNQSSQDMVSQQTQQNRPDQTNAFGASTTWGVGPDGKPVQTQSFGGPMGDAANSLQQQAQTQLSSPFDLGSLGKMGTGDSARDQAIQAAYGQASSRLDPMFQQRRTQLESRLANQGLDANSEAYRNSIGDFDRAQNDAYGSAMNSAIGQGTAAGSAVFGQNMMARQQQLAEMLRGRGQALGEMQQMQGLLNQPQFNAAGQAQATQYLPAYMAHRQEGMHVMDAMNGYNADAAGGVMDSVGGILKMFGLG